MVIRGHRRSRDRGKGELCSPDPWVRNVLGVLRRTYSIGVTRACDLRRGIMNSSAIGMSFQPRVLFLSSLTAPNASWPHLGRFRGH